MSPAQTYDQSDGGDLVGPHPSYIQLAREFMSEGKIQDLLKATGVQETKEDAMRLQGVTWIDNTRKALRLPVRTFDTACILYHKYRLVQSDSDYAFIDAVAAAALFTACKIEDTQKRSRDILCAAYNLKVQNPSEQLTQDDPRFETQAKSVIGLERGMLESSAFDFRSTHPQKLVVKLARAHDVNKDTVGKTAYDMSIDLYRTFAPLKQTSQTLAYACVELAGRLLDEPIKALEEGRGYRRWHTTREEVMETMQDLLELYIQHGSKGGTIVGQGRTVEAFIAIRIPLNQEATKDSLPRFCAPIEPQKSSSANGNSRSAANGRGGPPSSKPSPTSPADSLKTPGTNESPSTPRREREARAQGTVRFMLDGEMAREEKETVDQYFRVEMEEVEIEEEVEASKLRNQEREREEPGRGRGGGGHHRGMDRDRDVGGGGGGGGGRGRPWDRGHDRPPRDGPGRMRDRDREREERFHNSRYDRDHDRDPERFRDRGYDREHERDRRRL